MRFLTRSICYFWSHPSIHKYPTLIYFVLLFLPLNPPFNRISCTAANLGSDRSPSTLYCLPADKTVGMEWAPESMGTAFPLFLSWLDKGQYSGLSKQWAGRPALPYIISTSLTHLVHGVGQRQISCLLKPGVPVCGIIIFSQNTCLRCGSAPVSGRPPTLCAVQRGSETDESFLLLKCSSAAGGCVWFKKQNTGWVYRNRYSLRSPINQTLSFYILHFTT